MHGKTAQVLKNLKFEIKLKDKITLFGRGS